MIIQFFDINEDFYFNSSYDLNKLHPNIFKKIIYCYCCEENLNSYLDLICKMKKLKNLNADIKNNTQLDILKQMENVKNIDGNQINKYVIELNTNSNKSWLSSVEHKMSL